MAESILPSKLVKNRVGHSWGRWTVESFAGYNKIRQALWLCRCRCGTTRTFSSGTIAAECSESCGCIRNEMTAARNTTHGGAKRGRQCPEYVVWCGMKQRCFDKNATNYSDYGGRGVGVCERWLGNEGFANFLADVGERPSKKHTIERRDNDAGYSPENCFWALRVEQRRNQRNPRLRPLEFRGETLLVVEWADRLGIPRDTLFMRLHRGWDVERALTTPVNRLTRGNVA